MRRLLLILFIITLALPCYGQQQIARMNPYVAGVVVAAAAGDSCTGTLTFSWHAENVDVTEGTPTGCSAGDTTATASSAAAISSTQAWDGTYSASFPTSYDYYTFDSASIFSATQGTIVFRFYITTWLAGVGFSASIDGSNNMYVQTLGTDEFRIKWEGQDNTEVADTTDANLSTATWYTITAKWNTADVNPNLWIQVCDTNNENCSTAISNNTNLTAWSGSLSTFVFGNQGEPNAGIYMDGIKIYNSASAL